MFVDTPNWSGNKRSGNCLASVLAVDYPKSKVEVDSGSTNGSAGFIREKFSLLRVVEMVSNPGYAGAFNAGLEYATARGPGCQCGQAA